MEFKYLFSFSGRASRADYWVAFLINLGGALLALPLMQLAFESVVFAVVMLAYLVAYVVFASWVGLAAMVRRLHDRNKSAWWLVPYWLVPAVIGFGGQLIGGTGGSVLYWASVLMQVAVLIEIGFLRGTVGANAWGADPLDVPPAVPVAA